MLYDVRLKPEDAKLEDLFFDLSSIDEEFDFAKDILDDIDDAKEDPRMCRMYVDRLYFVLNSLQRYFIDIKPLIKKYYYYEYNVERGKHVERGNVEEIIFDIPKNSIPEGELSNGTT